MKERSIRIVLDVPLRLYQQLAEQATTRGSSVSEVVLMGVKSIVFQTQRPRSKRVRFPLIVSKGPKVKLSNKQIYEHVEFP